MTIWMTVQIGVSHLMIPVEVSIMYAGLQSMVDSSVIHPGEHQWNSLFPVPLQLFCSSEISTVLHSTDCPFLGWCGH